MEEYTIIYIKTVKNVKKMNIQMIKNIVNHVKYF